MNIRYIEQLFGSAPIQSVKVSDINEDRESVELLAQQAALPILEACGDTPVEVHTLADGVAVVGESFGVFLRDDGTHQTVVLSEGTMTKQHFVAVAEKIATDSRIKKPVKAVIADILSDVFAQFNPNFNRARFVRACGVSPAMADKASDGAPESELDKMKEEESIIEEFEQFILAETDPTQRDSELLQAFDEAKAACDADAAEKVFMQLCAASGLDEARLLGMSARKAIVKNRKRRTSAERVAARKRRRSRVRLRKAARVYYRRNRNKIKRRRAFYSTHKVESAQEAQGLEPQFEVYTAPAEGLDEALLPLLVEMGVDAAVAFNSDGLCDLFLPFGVAESVFAYLDGNVNYRQLVEALSVPEQHQKKIAISTLKMNDIMANVMGGMTKEQARKFLKEKCNYTDAQIAKLEESGEGDDEEDAEEECKGCGEEFPADELDADGYCADCADDDGGDDGEDDDEEDSEDDEDGEDESATPAVVRGQKKPVREATDKVETRVMFRVWRGTEDVIALLLDLNHESGDTTKPGRVMAYEHVGQHGEADLGIVADTRAATPAEYADLKKELEGRGYVLTVVQRNQPERKSVREAKGFDAVSFIMDWEGGDMDPEEEAAGFQHLIDSGMIGHLQGMYGRRAAQLIASGACHAKGKKPVREDADKSPFFVKKVGDYYYAVNRETGELGDPLVNRKTAQKYVDLLTHDVRERRKSQGETASDETGDHAKGKKPVREDGPDDTGDSENLQTPNPEDIVTKDYQRWYVGDKLVYTGPPTGIREVMARPEHRKAEVYLEKGGKYSLLYTNQDDSTTAAPSAPPVQEAAVGDIAALRKARPELAHLSDADLLAVESVELTRDTIEEFLAVVREAGVQEDDAVVVSDGQNFAVYLKGPVAERVKPHFKAVPFRKIVGA
jgi:hypothetical protein